MKRHRITCLVLGTLAAGPVLGFEFEVDCDNEIATLQSVSERFQRYTGNWAGEWQETEYLRFLPDRIKGIAASFHYHQNFRVEVVGIKGCKISLKVYYEPDGNDFTLYHAEVMTEEGLYIYWNSPEIDGTYILDYNEERDVLDGVLQLFEGQNIAEIEMRRL